MSSFEWLMPAGGTETDFSVRLAMTLLHFLWQGCAIAVITAGLHVVLARRSAAVRYGINTAALLLMVACVPTTFVLLSSHVSGHTVGVQTGPQEFQAESEHRFRPAPAGEVSVSADLADSAAGAQSVRTAEFPVDQMDAGSPVESSQTRSSEPAATGLFAGMIARFSPWLAAIYCAGVLFMLTRLCRSLWSGYQLKLSSAAVDDDDLLAIITRQAQRVGLQAAPAMRFCNSVSVPTVIGVLRPVVLLPMYVVSGLTPEQLTPLIAHELAHIRRFDLFVNLLQRVIEAFLFFHPAVWFISRRISIERENACDDLVLSAGCPRVSYADALVRMAEVSAVNSDSEFAGHAALAASGGNASELKRRVMRVLGGEDQPRLRLTRSGLSALLTVIALSVLMPFGILALADTGGAETNAAESPLTMESSDESRLHETVAALEKEYASGEAPMAVVLAAHLNLFKSESDRASSTQDRIAAVRRRIQRLKTLVEVEKEMLRIGRDTSKNQPAAAESELYKVETQLEGMLEATAHDWRVLEPQRLELDSADTARVLRDNSVQFESPGPEGTDSRIIFDPETRRVTHLKFEAMNDATLPGGGPGRAADGTFLLFALELYHVTKANAPHGEYVEIRNAFTDQEEESHPAGGATDFLSDTSWIAPSPDFPNAPVTAVLELYEPLQLGPDDRLAVRIDAGYRDHRTPGRVRFSVASDHKVAATPDESDDLRTVRVRFTGGKDEEPLEGLTVTADSEWRRLPRTKFQPADQATTDASGIATLELPPGETYLRLSSADPVPWLFIPHGYDSHPVHYVRWITVGESDEPDEYHFNLARACELTIRVVDEETSEGVSGVKIGTENAIGEMWMQVLVPECIGANRPLRHFNSPGVKRTGDDTTKPGQPPASDYETDADGFYRVHVLPRPGWTYMIYSCPEGYERPGFEEVEIPTPPGSRVKHVFKVRRKAESSDESDDSPTDESPEEASKPPAPWGHLKGRFATDGDFPGLPRLPTSRDVSEFGDSAPDESLLVDRDSGGISNIAVYLRSKDVPVYNGGDDPTRTAQTMDFSGLTIRPRVIPIQTGQPFVVHNRNRVAHNAHMQLFRNDPYNFLIPPLTQMKPVVFDQREPLPARVFDAIHFWQQAWLLICDHPYMAISARDGSFEIRNLPAGELEFQCWHERTGLLAAKPEWQRGRFNIDVKPGTTHDLGTIRLPLSEFVDAATLKESQDETAKRIVGLKQLQGRWDAVKVTCNMGGKQMQLASWPQGRRTRDRSIAINGETITGIPTAPDVEVHLKQMRTAPGTFIPVLPVVAGKGTVSRNRTPGNERLVIEGTTPGGERTTRMCLYRLLNDGAFELAIQHKRPHNAPVAFDAADAVVLRFERATERPSAAGGNRSPETQNILRGADAARYVSDNRPAWGDSVSGVQIGLVSRTTNPRLRAGQRLPLQYCIRNVGSKPVEIQFALDFYRHGPAVSTADGAPVTVETADDDGATMLHHELLPPDGVVVYYHYGLGVGQRPTDFKSSWHPYAATLPVGRYSLRQSMTVRLRSPLESKGSEDPDSVAPSDSERPYARVRLTSGTIPFAVRQATADKLRGL